MRRSISDSDNRSFSVEWNGKPLLDVLWADDATGEAEAYEHEWRLDQRGQRTGRTFMVKGDITIINHPSDPGPPPDLFDGFSNYQGY